MIVCRVQGGLGNQLFQIFTTMAYALRSDHGPPVFLPRPINPTNTPRKTYWTSFLRNLARFTESSALPPIPTYTEPHFHYAPIPSGHARLYIDGYFQSHKYFRDEADTIRDMIGVTEMKDTLKGKFKHDFSKSISLHVRRGDYKQLSPYHNILPLTYYKRALTCLSHEVGKTGWTVFYTCEEEDMKDVGEMIGSLVKEFRDITFQRISAELEDWEQMLFMACCHHNIIANSSFSWWSAYLNEHSDKCVMYPDTWFGPRLQFHNLKDLCPSNWTKVDTQLKKSLAM